MKLKRYLLMLAVMLLGVTTASSQIQKFQALFIYNFAQNTNWEKINQDELVITVVGDSDLARVLKAMSQTRKVGNRLVVVKVAPSVEVVMASQIVIFGKDNTHQLQFFRDDDVLVVSGKDGMCKSGADICFKMVNEKLRFEINLKTIEAKNLSVSSKLATLGIKVE